MHAKTLRTLAWGALLGGVAFGCAASSATSPLAADEDDGKGGSAGDDGKGGSGNTTSTGGASGTDATTGGASGTSSAAGGTGSSTGGTGSSTGGSSGTGSTMPPPGRPTIPLPFTDDFETSMAADWRFITPNGWAVSDDGGNQVLLQQIQNSSSEATWAIGGDRNWTDVKVEMRVKFVSGDGMILLSPRWKDLKNYYFVEYEMEDKPKLRRRLDGSTADIVTAADTMTFTLGQWHTVSVTLQGGNATLAFDGTEIGTGTDATPVVSGGIGIATEDCIVAIDDVSVTEP